MSGSRVVPGGFALPTEESSSLSTPAAFGMYRVLHQTGSGVLGPVFRAFDLQHDRLVAIKAFTLELSVDQVAHLVRALRRLAATAVASPAIVWPVEAGVEGTTPYVVLPGQSGETLDVWIRRLAPAPPEHAVPVLRQLAATLDLAAAQGLDHGTLHPRDVFVTARGDVSVTGIGIARALAEAGIPRPIRRPYAAPEQEQGLWDTRADVYSLGVIAHEMLTRRLPLASGDQAGEFTAELAPAKRVQVRRVLGRALSTHPGARFATASAFVDALEAAGVGTLSPVSEQVVNPPLDQPVGRPGTPDVGCPQASPDAWAPSTQAPLLIDAWTAQNNGPRFVDSARGPGWRLAHVVGLVTLGLLGVLVGHLAVRTLRPVPAVVTVAPPGVVEQTDVVVGPRESAGELSAALPASVQRAAPAAVGGRVLVRSEPSGALVRLDGRHVGHTPAVVDDVEFGGHRVEVARPGFVPRVIEVTLGAERPEQRVSVALRPGLTAGAGDGAIDVAPRPRGARVLVGGRFVGRSPLRLPRLAPGTYAVTLELAGYHPVTGRVRVSPGSLVTFTPTLRSTHR